MNDQDTSADFLRRAAAEAARYGQDPYVFLRELGQNARDANAGRIKVQMRFEPDSAWLLFSDDGAGMSLEHARAYLFRLYASSKEAEAASAGRFGVGFWSVLRWAPKRIEVHSVSQGRAWAVGLSGDLRSWQRLACRRKTCGTSVVLVRPLAHEGPEQLRDEVHRGLVRYLAHLRTAGARPKPLPVRFDGRAIERPFQLQGPGALRFREGPLEGVVGFGPQPAYRLYARGLPVSEGAFLEELEGRPGGSRQREQREGVAPVYLLNGNNLEVVLSRQTVLQDRALKELVRVARARFEELVARTIDGAVPHSFGQRLASLAARLARSFGRAPAWLRISGVVAALLLLGGAIGLGTAWLHRPEGTGRGQPAAIVLQRDAAQAPGAEPGRAPDPRARAVKARRLAVQHPGDWAGVRTGTVVAGASDAAWDFDYSPGRDLMFRRSLLTRYDSGLGFQAAMEEGPWGPPEARPGGDGVEIRLRLDGAGGAYILPVPTGYAPAAGSCRLEGLRLPLRVNPLGLARIEAPAGVSGPLRYGVVKAGPAPAALLAQMSSGFGRRLPAALERELDGLQSKPVAKRIAAATRLVQDLLAYDRSPATAAAFRQRLGRGGDWASAVVAIGAGDCDVINGLAVLVLKRLRVPARLVAGMIGRAGRVQDGWHAWIEILDQGRLEVLDASRGADPLWPDRPAEPAPAVAAPAQAARAVPAARRAPRVAVFSGQAGPSGNRLRTVGLGLLWFALGLTVMFMLYALKRRGQLAVTANDDQRRELLAGMAADALRRPKAWKDVQGIWHRAFLPCVGGKAISLARLVKLCRAERAFVGRAGSKLVGEATRCGLVVLSADDPHFGPLYSRTANLRDLDELARNRPIPRPKGLIGLLLEDLDGLLASSGCRVACRAVRPDGSGRAFWDVDLRPIRPRRRSGWPARFVAVDAEHPWWRAIEQLYSQAPALATCVALDRLAAASSLLSARTGPLRRAAARRALAEGGGGP